MRRTFALLLALLLTVGLLAGCNGSDEETDPSSEPDNTDPTTVPSFVPIDPDDQEFDEIELPLTEDEHTFTYWQQNGYSFEDFSTYDDNLFYQWMEEQTGVDIEWIHPPAGSETENFQTMVLSADYPDFIQGIKGYYTGGVDKAINDGVLRRLNELVDQYMPHYRSYVYGSEETFIQAVSDSGNLWGVHHIVDYPQTPWIGLTVRQDWLDKLGLTTADMETLDQFESVLTSFKEFTYENQGPLWVENSSTYAGDCINGTFGFGGYSSRFMNKDGVAAYSGIQPGVEEYAAVMADWYAKGLINKNYIAENSWSTPEQYWVNSQIGVGEMMYTQDKMYAASAAISELNPDPNFAISPLAGVKKNASDDWSDIKLRNSQDKIRPGNSMGITTGCTDDEIELACRFWDYAWTDEGITAANWGPYEGPEGDTNTTYFVDENDSNGDGHKECYQAWQIAKYGNVSQTQAKVAVYNGPVYCIWSREWCALDSDQMKMPGVWGQPSNEWKLPEGVTLTSDEGNSASSIVANCNTVVNEWLAAVITGVKSADTFQAEVVAQCESLGIHEAEGYYQAALDRYFARANYMD